MHFRVTWMYTNQMYFHIEVRQWDLYLFTIIPDLVECRLEPMEKQCFCYLVESTAR